MTTDDLKQLLLSKQVELLADDQDDPAHGLRLLLTDADTGEVGLLAIEPRVLVLPDEAILDYSYQTIEAPRMAHYDECDYDVLTKTGPDYDRGEVPFLFDSVQL